MVTYLQLASTIADTAAESEILTTEQVCKLLLRAGECVNKAAKAGGFFSTKSFLKWLENQA